jgi:hypothetical protein
MARRRPRNISGVSAVTIILPSCPGLTIDAMMPVSSNATPAPSAAPQMAPRARANRYMNQPARTRWMKICRFIASWTGRNHFSIAVG